MSKKSGYRENIIGREEDIAALSAEGLIRVKQAGALFA
jgi:hypothetical protein